MLSFLIKNTRKVFELLSRIRQDNSIFERIFYMMYSVIIFMNIMSSSQITEWRLWGHLNTAVLGVALAVILIAYLVYGYIDRRAFLVGAVLLILCLLIRQQSDKGRDIIYFTAFAYLGAFIDREKAVRRHVIIASATVILVIILYYSGVFYSRSIGRSGEDIVREYLGFNYTTYAANFLFHIVIAYFFVKKKQINLIETGIIVALNIIIFRLTDTQAVFYELFAFLAVLWIIRVFPRLFRYRIFKILTTWLMPVLALIIFALSILYSSDSNILSKADKALSGRLSLANEAISRYGIHPFGNKTEWSTGILGEDRFDDYFYVDSSYINISLTFGVIILIFIIIGFMILGRRMHNEGKYLACVALIFLALHSFTDPQLFEPRYDPMILYLGAAYIYKGKIPLEGTLSEENGENLMNAYQKNEREIRVRTLALRVLKKWYIILIVAAAIGALGTAYRVASNYKSISGSDTATTQEEYQKKLDEYNRNVDTYKKTLDDMEANIQSKLDYIASSELLKIDPNRESLANVHMYFVSDDFSSQNAETDYNANRIIDSYATFLSSGIDLKPLSEEMGIEEIYLQELLSTGKDYSTGSFTIYAKSNDPAKSRQILEYAIAQTDTLYNKAVSDFGDFKVTADPIRVNEVIDSSLQSTINNKATELKNLENSMKQVKQSYEKLEKPQAPASLGKKSGIKDALSFGAKCFAAGLGGMILLTALVIICRRRVLSPDELNKTYNLKEVAVIKKNTSDNSDIYDIASENIAEFSDGAKNVLLVGNAPNKQLFDLMTGIKERLPETQLDHTVKINESKESLDKLKNSDAVVFVEKTGRSNYKTIDKNFDYVANWGKKLIGSIVFQ